MVYTSDGVPLGVVLVKKMTAEEAGGDGPGMMMNSGDLAIVRPVEDLLDVAKQALEMKKTTN